MIEIRQRANADLYAFRGSSEEEKPVADIAPGSTFYEWDTCKGFMFDGEEWLLQTSGGGGGGVNRYTLLSLSSADSELVLPDSNFATPMFYFWTSNGNGAKAVLTPGNAYTMAPGDTVRAYFYQVPEAKKDGEQTRERPNGTKGDGAPASIYIERYVHYIGDEGNVLLDDVEIIDLAQYDHSTGIEITAPAIDFDDLGIDAAFISAEYWA